MWGLILNRYVIGGILILGLLAGGYWLLESRWSWKEQAKTAEKIIEKTQEVQDEKQKIDRETHGLTDDELAEYFRSGRLPGQN